MPNQRREYKGGLHIHSTFSDGSGTIPEILHAARGLDFLLLSDHHTLGAREEGWEGWNDKTLVLVGEEVSSEDGDCLCFGTKKPIPQQQRGYQTLEHVQNQGGLAIIAHPDGKYRPLFRERDLSWKDWQTQNFHALEVWSYMFDWASTFKYYRWWWHYFFPRHQISGPQTQTLKRWDEICQKRVCAGLGGLDVHAKKLFPFTVLPYKHCFESLRTHILLKDPLKETPEDIPTVLSALAKGHCFIGFDGLWDSTGSEFRSQDHQISMGEESPYLKPTALIARTPKEAQISILKNGQVMSSKRGRELIWEASSPGVYRMEAKLNNRPWIYSNPIYLRSP